MVRAYVHTCAAKRCFNTRISHPKKGFFGFPDDPTLCKTWLENCKRTDVTVSDIRKSSGYYKLCADHFEANCFLDSTKTLLKRNSNPVPTVFKNNVEDSHCDGEQYNSAVDIDYPLEPFTDCDDPGTLHKEFLHPSELLVASERLPISYHSIQIHRKVYCGPEMIGIPKDVIDLNLKTELFQLDEFCRFCMNEVLDNYVDIFSDCDEARELREAYKIVFSKKIKFCDGMPHKICLLCVTDLNRCRSFLEQFQNTEQYINEILSHSLFVDNEGDSHFNDSGFDVDDYRKEEFAKPTTKRSLKKIKTYAAKNTKYTLGLSEEMSATTPLSSSNENTSYEMKNRKAGVTAENEERVSAAVKTTKFISADSFAQNSQLIKLPTSLVNLIANEQNLIKNNIKVVYSNTFDSPSNEDISQNSIACESSSSSATSKRIHDSEKGCEDIDHSNKESYKENSINFTCSVKEISEDKFKDGSVKVKSTKLLKVNSKVKGTSSRLNVPFQCLECHKTYPNFSSLLYHVLRSQHKHPIICPKGLKKKSTLPNKHIRKTRQCTKCEEKGFISRNKLVDHIVKNHSYKCSLCDALCYSQKKLKDHIAVKHDTRTVCSVCGKQFKSSNFRRTHELTHDQDCTEVCWICGRTLKNKQTLTKHLKLHDEETHTCGVCDKLFTSRKAFHLHKKLHKHENQTKKFPCLSCPKVFAYKQNLTAHMHTHTALNSFKCDSCGKEFSLKTGLLNHQRRRNRVTGHCPFMKITDQIQVPLPSLQCGICKRKFIKTESLKRHIKFHFCSENPIVINKMLEEPEVHECDVCLEPFFSKFALQNHTSLHTGLRVQFKCDFCEKSFDSLNKIVVHEYSHLENKNLTAFLSENDCFDKVKVNLRTEPKRDKPYSCQICDKIFSTKTSLLRHSSLHTADTTYSCSDCGKVFLSEMKLKGHKKRMHEVKNITIENMDEVVKETEVVMLEDNEEAAEETIKEEVILDPQHTMEYLSIIQDEQGDISQDVTNIFTD